jgi:predicted PilT family ATPase
MKIIKFEEYNKLNENLTETPEEYIKIALLKIKNKLQKMFASEEDSTSKMSFAKMGIELESLELSRYSRTLDNVKLKFSDEEFLYDLMIAIHIKEAVPKKDKEFKPEDIKKCYIKFKKYDKHEPGEVLAEIAKNIKINEDFLVSLKIELDEQSGEEDSEEFKIETE